MKLKIQNYAIIGIALFHIFVQFILLIVGEGILFGVRYVDNPIRIFAAAQIIISIISVAVITKYAKLGNLIFGVSAASAYIIEFGHRLDFWPCLYCELYYP